MSWDRSRAAKKGWETRKFREFEDPQLPMPFKRGVRKGRNARKKQSAGETA